MECGYAKKNPNLSFFFLQSFWAVCFPILVSYPFFIFCPVFFPFAGDHVRRPTRSQSQERRQCVCPWCRAAEWLRALLRHSSTPSAHRVLERYTLFLIIIFWFVSFGPSCEVLSFFFVVLPTPSSYSFLLISLLSWRYFLPFLRPNFERPCEIGAVHATTVSNTGRHRSAEEQRLLCAHGGKGQCSSMHERCMCELRGSTEFYFFSCLHLPIFLQLLCRPDASVSLSLCTVTDRAEIEYLAKALVTIFHTRSVRLWQWIFCAFFWLFVFHFFCSCLFFVAFVQTQFFLNEQQQSAGLAKGGDQGRSASYK